MLPEGVRQAYHPQGPTMALHSAMGSSLLPCSVHARATRTLLMQQTDKDAWDRLSKLRATEPQMSNWFWLFHQLLRPVCSFIHSFILCVLEFCVHVSVRVSDPLEVQLQTV